MATKPAADPQFDSNLTNISATTSGHKTDGYANNEVPTAAEFNYWMNLVYLWILWLKLNIATINRTKLQSALFTTGWAATTGIGAFSVSGNSSYCWSWTTSVATASLTTSAIDLPDGYKLTSYSFTVGASTATPTGALVVTLVKSFTPPAAGTTLIGTYTIANGSWPTTATKQTLNLAASGALSAQTVTVALGGSCTYTRSAGSYLTDGFFVGQVVQWAGFVNGGNNAKITITALTATVMTCVITTQVIETGGVGAASVNGVAPVLDGTFTIHASYAMTATGAGNSVAFGGEQYTGVPQ